MMDIFILVGTILMLLIFYVIYIAKMLKQRRQGIKTNQMGKGKKEIKTLIIENILHIVSWLIVVVQLLCIIMNWTMFPDETRFTGVLIGLIGDVIFGVSVYTMRDSWRAGIPEKDETKIVTTGIYHYSRNPAFLGFYLLYLGVLIAYFSPLLLIMTVITIVTFHLQVLQEEKYLMQAFGEEYTDYKKHVFRYLGKR